jgi:hypothetical protein
MRRPVVAKDLDPAQLRRGRPADGSVGTRAEDRFWEQDPLPRAHVCLSELLDLVGFDGSRAEKGRILLRGGRRTLVALTRPDYDQFRRELDAVHAASAERAERATEILAQVVPPQAWWASIVNLRPGRHRHTMEFVDAVLNLVVIFVYRLKHHAGCPRPVEYSPQIQPLIPTPGHDSWPSGHATEAFAAARVLATLAGLPDTGRQSLFRHAARIARNREVAGVHFPVDSLAGCILGDTLARFVIATADPGFTDWGSRSFDPASDLSTLAHSPGADIDLATVPDRLPLRPAGAAPQALGLAWLWAKARAEWPAA